MKKTLLKLLKQELLSTGKFKYYDNDYEFLEHIQKNLFLLVGEETNLYKDYLNLLKGGWTFNSQVSSDFYKDLNFWKKQLYKYLNKNSNAKKVLELLTLKEKEEGFIVGGANRNVLLNIKPKDFDFVTNVNIELLKKRFLKNGFKIKEVGQHFQVLMVEKNKDTFEIARFRKDLDHKGKGATNVEVGTFEDDWKRRDFTINALYANPLKNDFRNPTYNGFFDIKNKIIRFIGNPEERLKEDYLRGLRFYRFIKKYNLKPDKKSLKAVRRNFDIIMKNANPQRFLKELELITELNL